jgi:hypothetical protein
LPVPERLYWNRLTPGSVEKTTSHYSNTLRAMRPYLAAAPDSLKPLILLAHGMAAENQRMSPKLRVLTHEKKVLEDTLNHILNKPPVRFYRSVKRGIAATLHRVKGALGMKLK